MICSYYYHITFSEDVVSGLTPKVDLCQMQTPLMSVRLLKSYKYPSIPSRFIPISLSRYCINSVESSAVYPTKVS